MSMLARISNFAKDEQGVTAIEYAIVAVGVAAVVMTIFAAGGPVDDMLTGTFNTLGEKLEELIGNVGTDTPAEGGEGGEGGGA